MSSGQFRKPRKIKKGNAASAPEYFPSNKPTPSTKSHIRWSKKMEEVMLNTFYEEVLRNGKRADNGIRTESLKAAVDSVNTALRMSVTSDHVRTRLKTLRKDYKLCKEFLDLSGVGFTFDFDNKTVVAAKKDVWERYFLAHPDARNLRGKHFPYFEQLSLIIGNDYANGEGACAADEVDEEQVEGSPGVADVVGADSYTELRDDVGVGIGSYETSTTATTATNNESSSNCNESAPRVHPSPPPMQPIQIKRKKSRLGPSDPSNSDYAAGLMDAVKTLAVEFAGSNIDELCDAIKEVSNGDRVLYLKGLDFLGVEDKQAKIFLGMDTELRADWLVSKLNYVKSFNENEWSAE